VSNQQVYPNTVTVGGEVTEVTDLGKTSNHGRKVILTVCNPHRARAAYDLIIKVALYGHVARHFMEKHATSYPSIVFTGRMATERDGRMFVVANVLHELVEAS